MVLGESGIVLDPTKGNVYQIDIQYLGFGSVVFKVETNSTNGNNPDWTVMHNIKFPNSLTRPSLSNPSFPFTMAAYSNGSSTDLGLSVGSVARIYRRKKSLNWAALYLCG